MADTKDSLEARIPSTCPSSISQILTHAWNHDLASLKPLLDVPGRASVQEPTTGETPLHAAIRAAGNSSSPGKDHDLAAAKAVLEELFFSGAIWNDVDSNNETPGDVAARLGQAELYQMCVEAGVRAELLFGLLEGYEALEDDDDEDEDMEEADVEENGDAIAEDGDEAPELVSTKKTFETDGEQAQEEQEETEIVDSNPDRAFAPPKPVTADDQVTSDEYLRSNLTYTDGKLVDSSLNGVMMAWETEIMKASVEALLPGSPAGKKILNIGFGMGIIDTMFAEKRPSKHHIIEAHTEVMTYIKGPDCKFGQAWEASGPSEGAFKVHEGRWQDVVTKLMESGETYDAIYFDTFGEDYSQLRNFFTESVPGLLEEDGRFGFFNGLGADRQVCYDVYTKVVEMHLSDAGMDVEWQEMDVDMKALGEDGKGDWEGVKRRYWTLNTYRLPVCTFMG
ncbi:Arginine N-methyltransferase 2 [Pestalotiopsis fici W106-1]|uniref:Arginine N-methyltransferase 2 n=1 Tax=Pestalotiopsis fici (strain W106-1 / CGMCC3.15140) TaxID=1229662 RepID=W3XPX0_PESFW|nr:Arginine N-methyltransferase 2 [Pestalotiopsis fici W106-1]ETS87281.1 Arginine N-methyltransferase 2 [Pestalotiopsis fici W106-1]